MMDSGRMSRPALPGARKSVASSRHAPTGKAPPHQACARWKSALCGGRFQCWHGCMIPRLRHIDTLKVLLEEFPVTAIVGARQVGKTTLARQVAKQFDGPTHWFDLERPPDRERMLDPLLALEPLTGLIVVDEVQRAPELFSVLRSLADQDPVGRRFLVLGSASPELMRGSAQSLAGRIAYHAVSGFSLEEVGPEHHDSLWLRGGLPPSFLARSDEASMRWRKQYIRTFLERDVPQLGIGIPSLTLRRFWTMLCHGHGQVLNQSELGR
ncbi:MAG: ATP-binding protein, partial [Oligoflexia bacterium]|nr:ATP-binding protein [Oligoflexia bacterium]